MRKYTNTKQTHVLKHTKHMQNRYPHVFSFLDMNPHQSIAKKNQDTVLSTLKINGDFLSRNLSSRTRTMKSHSNPKCKKLKETYTIILRFEKLKKLM